jgi:hypothetical protein
MALKNKPLTEVRADVPTDAAARGELVRINFLVPAETRVQWKKAAIDSGKTMQQLIIDAMNQHFNTSMK